MIPDKIIFIADKSECTYLRPPVKHKTVNGKKVIDKEWKDPDPKFEWTKVSAHTPELLGKIFPMSEEQVNKLISFKRIKIEP